MATTYNQNLLKCLEGVVKEYIDLLSGLLEVRQTNGHTLPKPVTVFFHGSSVWSETPNAFGIGPMKKFAGKSLAENLPIGTRVHVWAKPIESTYFTHGAVCVWPPRFSNPPTESPEAERQLERMVRQYEALPSNPVEALFPIFPLSGFPLGKALVSGIVDNDFGILSVRDESEGLNLKALFHKSQLFTDSHLSILEDDVLWSLPLSQIVQVGQEVCLSAKSIDISGDLNLDLQAVVVSLDPSRMPDTAPKPTLMPLGMGRSSESWNFFQRSLHQNLKDILIQFLQRHNQVNPPSRLQVNPSSQISNPYPESRFNSVHPSNLLGRSRMNTSYHHGEDQMAPSQKFGSVYGSENTGSNFFSMGNGSQTLNSFDGSNTAKRQKYNDGQRINTIQPINPIGVKRPSDTNANLQFGVFQTIDPFKSQIDADYYTGQKKDTEVVKPTFDSLVGAARSLKHDSNTNLLHHQNLFERSKNKRAQLRSTEHDLRINTAFPLNQMNDHYDRQQVNDLHNRFRMIPMKNLSDSITSATINDFGIQTINRGFDRTQIREMKKSGSYHDFGSSSIDGLKFSSSNSNCQSITRPQSMLPPNKKIPPPPVIPPMRRVETFTSSSTLNPKSLNSNIQQVFSNSELQSSSNTNIQLMEPQRKAIPSLFDIDPSISITNYLSNTLQRKQHAPLSQSAQQKLPGSKTFAGKRSMPQPPSIKKVAQGSTSKSAQTQSTTEKALKDNHQDTFDMNKDQTPTTSIEKSEFSNETDNNCIEGSKTECLELKKLSNNIPLNNGYFGTELDRLSSNNLLVSKIPFCRLDYVRTPKLKFHCMPRIKYGTIKMMICNRDSPLQLLHSQSTGSSCINILSHPGLTAEEILSFTNDCRSHGFMSLGFKGITEIQVLQLGSPSGHVILHPSFIADQLSEVIRELFADKHIVKITTGIDTSVFASAGVNIDCEVNLRSLITQLIEEELDIIEWTAECLGNGFGDFIKDVKEKELNWERPFLTRTEQKYAAQEVIIPIAYFYQTFLNAPEHSSCSDEDNMASFIQKSLLSIMSKNSKPFDTNFDNLKKIYSLIDDNRSVIRVGDYLLPEVLRPKSETDPIAVGGNLCAPSYDMFKDSKVPTKGDYHRLKEDRLGLWPICYRCGFLKKDLHEQEHCKEGGNFSGCEYPLCSDRENEHSVKTCKSLHRQCEVCHRRGHRSEDHLTHHPLDLDYTFLRFAPCGIITSLPFFELSPRAAECFDYLWRVGLYNRDRNNSQRLLFAYNIPFIGLPIRSEWPANNPKRVKQKKKWRTLEDPEKIKMLKTLKKMRANCPTYEEVASTLNSINTSTN